MRTQVADSGRRVRANWLVPLLVLALLVVGAAGIIYLSNLSLSTFLVALST